MYACCERLSHRTLLYACGRVIHTVYCHVNALNCYSATDAVVLPVAELDARLYEGLDAVVLHALITYIYTDRYTVLVYSVTYSRSTIIFVSNEQ
jgi:hypothetical protein